MLRLVRLRSRSAARRGKRPAVVPWTAPTVVLALLFGAGPVGRPTAVSAAVGDRVITRLADINQVTVGSSPTGAVAMGGRVFFAADDGVNGEELWMSDGTELGTVMVRDIWPGADDGEPGESSPANLVVVGDTLYFSADDGANGRELWKSDGTRDGTVMVGDIRPGSDDSSPSNLTAVDLVAGGEMLFFTANDGTHGEELWMSNGTSGGTVMVGDIYPGSDDGSPMNLTAVGGTLFFAANDGSNGTELWKSDGTTGGTVMVRDVRPGSNGSSPSDLTEVDDRLFFVADDGSNGTELWISDGTTVGTVMVRDIRPGSSGGSPYALAAVGATLFFSADDGVNGEELWKSDGTTIGTVMVRDINAGSDDGGPWNLTAVGGTLFFSADDGVNGEELWKSDGTTVGTVMVRDIHAGADEDDPEDPNSSSPWNLTAVGAMLFFVADDGVNGEELWKSDGTTVGTVMVRDIRAGRGDSGLSDFVAVGGTLYFGANDEVHSAESGFGATTELWVSDGSVGGTKLVKDINTQTMGSEPSQFMAVGSIVYFTADDGVHGRELWKTDGTTVGTRIVKDICEGSDDGMNGMSDDDRGSKATPPFAVAGTTLFFLADDCLHGIELWKTDGTTAGTVMVDDLSEGNSEIRSLTALGTKLLFFRGDDPVNGRELWMSDGDTMSLVKDINPGPTDGISSGTEQLRTVVMGDFMYFYANDDTHGFELWRTDGTTAGTTLVKDINPGDGGSVSGWTIPSFAVSSGELYFVAEAPGGGAERLWRTDGTDAGTVEAATDPRVDWLQIRYLTAHRGHVYFAAGENDDLLGADYELWRTDGTTAGTAEVSNIQTGIVSNPTTIDINAQFFPVKSDGTTVFLVANDLTDVKLWTSSGTLGSERKIEQSPENPQRMTVFDSSLYFTAQDGNEKQRLWIFDGATVEEVEIGSASGGNAPRWLTVVGDKMFLSADTDEHGRELWMISDLPATGGGIGLPGSSSIVPMSPPVVRIVPPAVATNSIHVIAEFADKSSSLTSELRRQVRTALLARPNATSAECKGFVKSGNVASTRQIKLANDRARAICGLLKSLRPSLETTISRGSATSGPRRVRVVLRD